MTIRNTVTVLNAILAVASIPPSVYLVRLLINERAVLEGTQKKLNTALTYVFGGIGTASLLNAMVSIASIVGFGFFAHTFSPIRSAIANLFFTVASWSLYLVQREL